MVVAANFRLGFPLVVTVGLCVSSIVAAQEAPRRPAGRVIPLSAELTPHLQDLVDAFGLAGLAVGIVKDDEVIYARGFGVESTQTHIPVTPHTVFHAASISKTFVATAIMQLVEQGSIDLNEPLVTYLPYFSLADDRYSEITIKQMLVHTSGFPDVDDYHWQEPEYDDGALERYVRSLASEHMIADPGADWSYSNMAFDVLGDVIAKVSGALFEDYERQAVLEPSGMVQSSFLKPQGLPPAWAAPHLMNLTPRAWEGYPYHRAHAPSSTLHTNVIDLCKWAMINLNRGTFAEGSILDTSTYDILWEPHALFPPDRGLFHSGGGQGIAWALAEYKGDVVVGHSGSDVGFTSNLILIPGKSIAVVVLCNSYNYVTSVITATALDAVLGYPVQSVPKPASIAVCKILQEHGVDAAEAQWHALRLDHPDDYDFGVDYFYIIAEEILTRGTEEEAALLACLFTRIMQAEEIEYALGLLVAHQLENPGNAATETMLQILRDGSSCG